MGYCAEILDLRRALLLGDLHCAQGSTIRRSSPNAELDCVALPTILALCGKHWMVTFAARMALLCGRPSFCAWRHCVEALALRQTSPEAAVAVM
jgi:hypothetical protein